MRGSHFGQTFYVRRTDHDPAYRRFSPGTTLIQLVIEDLIKDNRFKLMNLGWGHPSYEHQTAHDVRDYTLVWLFSTTWKNRLIRSSYRAFRSTVSSVKAAVTAATCPPNGRGKHRISRPRRPAMRHRRFHVIRAISAAALKRGLPPSTRHYASHGDRNANQRHQAA